MKEAKQVSEKLLLRANFLGFSYSQAFLFEILLWLHEFDIYIQIEKTCIGSDEWEFSYIIEHLPLEHQNAKRKSNLFETIRSFQDNMSTYSGAWEDYEDALENAIDKALEIKESYLFQIGDSVITPKGTGNILSMKHGIVTIGRDRDEFPIYNIRKT